MLVILGRNFHVKFDFQYGALSYILRSYNTVPGRLAIFLKRTLHLSAIRRQGEETEAVINR